MSDISIHRARVVAVADALRAVGFDEPAPGSDAAVTVLTAASDRAAVLVRIVPQHTSRHSFVTLICAACQRHQGCGWRAHLGADVPAPVVSAAAQAALSAPMPCETACHEV